VPHITLLREARRAPAQSRLAPIAWPVSEFALVESVQLDNSHMYEVLQSWRLGA
jgi:2'-5' RNA ligase